MSWMGEELIVWKVNAVKNPTGKIPITTLPGVGRADESTHKCQSVPDGWTNVTERLSHLFGKTLALMLRMDSEVSV